MKNRLLIRIVPIAIAAVVIWFQYQSAETITNEAGRKAKVGLSSKEEAVLGAQSFQQVLSQNPPLESGQEVELVREVASRLAQAANQSGAKFEWQVAVIPDKQVNAFCLPGGKIVVYTGILPVAKNPAGLATVMGHEMAHATLRHGSERLLSQKAKNTFMTGVQFSVGGMDYEQQRAIMTAVGAGAEYGILMPFGRDHESEADAVGLTYMARAGYDPREAVHFWERMEQAGGKGPPEFLSTHPSHGTRIEQIKRLLPDAIAIYEGKLER